MHRGLPGVLWTRSVVDPVCTWKRPQPSYGKTVGLAANLEREQAFVDSVAEFKTFEARPAIGENFSSYENVMEWTSKDGQEIRVEQVAVQHWRDGKIYYERFYYDNK